MELLKALYEIYSPSGGEKTLKRFIKRWVRVNVPDAVLRTDNNDGNIYICKGLSDTFPCVVAHLDQVQRNHSSDFIAVETDDIIFGYSPKNRRREGLGADDKNGIWVALKCLEEFDDIKVVFFVGEEIGCVGSNRCDIWWFKDCRFIIEADRRGAFDLITDISGSICSKEFEAMLPSEKYGYKPEYGIMTDVEALSSRDVGVSCINVSCGYYEPHTDNEFTVKADLFNCLNFVKEIIYTCTDVYAHHYEDYYSQGIYGGRYYDNRYDPYGDYDSYYPEIKRDKVSVAPATPKIPKAINHLSLNRYIEELIINNVEYFTPEDLYPFVEEELTWFGATKDEFFEIADQFWEFYACYGVDVYDRC